MNLHEDMEYVITVCRIGQLKNCCRYLVADQKGFECVKEMNAPDIIRLLDARVEANTITAQGNNCQGYLEEKKKETINE